jgi:hypothetical protein
MSVLSIYEAASGTVIAQITADTDTACIEAAQSHYDNDYYGWSFSDQALGDCIYVTGPSKEGEQS